MATASKDDPASQLVDIIDKQQEYYEILGHKTETVYDCYTTKELLKHKLGVVMLGMEADKLAELIETIWMQRKFSGQKCLFMSLIFVLCVHDADSDAKNRHPIRIRSKQFTHHPVFRIQKCTRASEASCGKPCALFVDEYARVYKNWEDFCENNRLENSLVIAPVHHMECTTERAKMSWNWVSSKKMNML